MLKLLPTVNVEPLLGAQGFEGGLNHRTAGEFGMLYAVEVVGGASVLTDRLCSSECLD